MAISDLNRRRSQPLAPATVDRMARQYRFVGAQYSILSDGPAASDKTIMQFLDLVEKIDDLRNANLRADTAGTMQALTGLWQIFCRQGTIRAQEADEALAGILSGFGAIRNSRDVFDAGRAGVKVLLKATHSPEDAPAQERFLNLLAGIADPSDQDAHNRVVDEMARIFEAQRLVSVSTLFQLADHLEALSRGEKLNTALINRLAARISEIQLPRSSMTGIEKNVFSFGYWAEKHVESQRKLNLRVIIDRAAGDAAKLSDARGRLTPFLRDSLTGLNYVHYAPPGAQVLLTNPLFVRTHDFLGIQGNGNTWKTTEVFGSGWPSSAGGRLVGSMAGLPYALAEAEQNFMIPSREQALIWGDLAPQMILSAKIPRWWDVTPAQMHWVGLHLRYAESLLAEAALNPDHRVRVLDTLAKQAPPARVRRVAQLLETAEVRAAADGITPAEAFAVAREALAQKPDSSGLPVDEIRRLASETPDTVNYAAVSRAFGTPKPTLTNSYQPELLYLRTFPTLMGYSSRIMAESWESNTLYWAALADEMHLSPGQLNVLIPEWTQQTVERIFATHLEDWPAVLRSLRNVGEAVRSKARRQMAADQKASLQ
jgi:hypothetical protein